SQRQVRVFSGLEQSPAKIAFSPNGKFLAAVEGSRVFILDVTSGDKMIIIPSAEQLSDITFSPDSNIVAAGVMNKTIGLWDVKTGKEIKVFSGLEEAPVKIAFSPNGKFFAAAEGSRIHLWDTESSRQTRVISDQKGRITDIMFSPNSWRLASADENRMTW